MNAEHRSSQQVGCRSKLNTNLFEWPLQAFPIWLVRLAYSRSMHRFHVSEIRGIELAKLCGGMC